MMEDSQIFVLSFLLSAVFSIVAWIRSGSVFLGLKYGFGSGSDLITRIRPDPDPAQDPGAHFLFLFFFPAN